MSLITMVICDNPKCLKMMHHQGCEKTVVRQYIGLEGGRHICKECAGELTIAEYFETVVMAAVTG